VVCRARRAINRDHQLWLRAEDAERDHQHAGGYLVFPEMSTAIIDLRETVRHRAPFLNVRQMSSDVQVIPRRTGGLTGYFAAEEAAFTESSKSWSQVRLQAQALGTLTKISRELEDDAVISVADDIASEIAYGLAVKEDATLWNGDGTSSYGGIVGVRSKFAAGVGVLAGAVDAASGHDTFAEYDAADLIKVIGTIPKYAEGNARWYGHRTGWANTFLRLIAAAGGNAIMDIQAGGKPQAGYLGYPFETDQTLPSALTDLSDTAVFLFGDLDAAVTMGERRGHHDRRHARSLLGDCARSASWAGSASTSTCTTSAMRPTPARSSR
jgi:HK97 family phage major capsid protein